MKGSLSTSQVSPLEGLFDIASVQFTAYSTVLNPSTGRASPPFALSFVSRFSPPPPPSLDSSPNPPIAILFLARLIFPRSATARRGAVSRIEERLEARRFFFLPHSSLPSPLLIGPVKLGNGFRGRAVLPMNIKSRLFGRNSHRARLSSGIISRFV